MEGFGDTRLEVKKMITAEQFPSVNQHWFYHHRVLTSGMILQQKVSVICYCDTKVTKIKCGINTEGSKCNRICTESFNIKELRIGT